MLGTQNRELSYGKGMNPTDIMIQWHIVHKIEVLPQEYRKKNYMIKGVFAFMRQQHIPPNGIKACDGYDDDEITQSYDDEITTQS